MKNFLKEERSKKQLTQVQLAEQVQVSRQTIISIENGRYIPSVSLCLKLAKVLGTTVEELFMLEDVD